MERIILLGFSEGNIIQPSFSVFTCEVAVGSVKMLVAENLVPERPGKRKTLTANK